MEIVNANILEFPRGVDAICHGCNIHNTFGAGLAAQIRKVFPSAYQADTDAYKGGVSNLGEISFSKIKWDKKDKWIFNLYQQEKFGPLALDYKALKNSMTKMREVCEKLELSVAIPFRIGCGLSGGDWRVVLEDIKEIWKNHKKEVIIARYEQV